MQYRKIHFNLRQWKKSLRSNIERCVTLIEQNPNDNRNTITSQDANIYEFFLNILEGNPDSAISQELWDYMTRISKESDNLKLKDDFPPKTSKTSITSETSEEVFEPIITSMNNGLDTEVMTRLLTEAIDMATEGEKVEQPKRKKKTQSTESTE